MIKILIYSFLILLSHICYSHPQITEYYDINEVNKLSQFELDRSRFDISLQSNLQISEYGFFDFSHPFNGRSIRISGILLPRDIEVYLRILSSPVLHNPPYNISLGQDERLMRHLGFVKGVVTLPQTGAAYEIIERILRNQVSSLTRIKDLYKPEQTWPTYLDNRAAYTNLWKHATNLFTVKLHPEDKMYYYLVNGQVQVFKYHISFDKTKFQDLCLLLGYWNFDNISIPDYLVKEFEAELNHADRSNYPETFFSKIEDLATDLNNNKLYKKYFDHSQNVKDTSIFFDDFFDLDDLENSFVDSDHNEEDVTEVNFTVKDITDTVYSLGNGNGVTNYRNPTDELFTNEHLKTSPANLQKYVSGNGSTFDPNAIKLDFDKISSKISENETKSRDTSETKSSGNNEVKNINKFENIRVVNWVGGLSWEEAMRVESRRVARVLIKILYKATRNMMKSHNIDISSIQRKRIKLYKTTLYSRCVNKLRNMINNSRLLTNKYDGILLDEEAEEILFESGSKYKVYWNFKNDSLYNKRTVSDRSADLSQRFIEELLFEPNRFYNKLINISGDSIDFKQVYDILLALTQETTAYVPKHIFSNTQNYHYNKTIGSGNKYKYVYNNTSVNFSRRIDTMVGKVLEQYRSLPSNANNLLRGRAKCLMAFLYLFGVSDSKGVVNFPHGWPRHIKKSMTLLISGMSSPCGLCNTLLGFLASIGFPPVSNNMYAWETRKNDEETTVYQLISGNLYNSFLKYSGSSFEIPSFDSFDFKSKSSNNKSKQSDKSNSNVKMNNSSDKSNVDASNKKDEKVSSDEVEDTNILVDRSGYDLPLLCYLSGSYKNDELSSLAYSYYIHSGIGNPSRTCQKSAQSSINRSPKNVGMMCLEAIPYAIESAKSSMKNKHDQFHDTSDEYKSKRYAEFIKKLSHMGDSDGLRMMGDFYYTGHEQAGIRRNYQQAINFWSRAAESGDPSSALAIAHHHLSNLQTDDSGHSAVQAERYLRMVLNSSSPNSSAFSTANFYLYRHGLGQPRDSAMAARYLRESADRGDVNSMVLMGHSYAGILTDVTPPEGRNIFMSFYYYRRAAQSGNIVGLFNSAVFTLHGYDLEYTSALDRCNEAYKLFSRVARMGTMSTALKVLSKRAKNNNDKIGHVLMNMLLSELGDSNAHRELSKHFKTNSVFCYTESLDPDITSPTTLFSAKNTSNSNNPVTFKNFQLIQNLMSKSNTPERDNTFYDAQSEGLSRGSTLGNMGANTNLTGTLTNTSPRVSYQDRNEVNRLTREIRMLNMVRVTEMPEDPEVDLRTRGLWNRDDSQNVSIFETIMSGNNKNTSPNTKNQNNTAQSNTKTQNTTTTSNTPQPSENELNVTESVVTGMSESEHGKTESGGCYYYYSRRGAYSPQNSTPLLLAEALLSGKPWLPSEALFWAKRSKESDSLKGSYMYATMMEAGLGAPKNCQASFKIFKEFMSSKSRGERILGLVCILRNKIISKVRHPHFLYTFLVKFLYDSYAFNNITHSSYTPCNYTFFDYDRIPPSGLKLLSFIYLFIVLFTLIVYFKITSH
uniref:Sel1 repeat, putative n=1 Tax=Theileria annulata TaxID=5874 RepID=A0A3B0N7G1_THEAN